MMAGASSTQYQHFVPQFLLRNFSHPYKPQGNGRRRSNRSKRKYEKGMFPNSPVVNTVDLLEDEFHVYEAPVNRILGQMDMYRDTSKPSPEQQQIEQMFSKLENQASLIFRKITKSFEQQEQGLWLKRDERDLVRKFLFLLKYRGSRFHKRFYHDDPESYDADDRELLREYMAEKRFSRPMDVWLHNLKTIMELSMDAEGKWIRELPKRMYFGDAMWFISHAQSMYMAICTPSNPSDEFILTDNSYNVFEGPNCSATDQVTGKIHGTYYIPLHEFAPISPKLMIVLRCFLFPVPEEDAIRNIKQERALFRSAVLDTVYNEEVYSLLADLPIAKARNNYSEIVDGRVQLNAGENGKKRQDHKFLFKYFPISAKHIHTINGIFLNNAYTCSKVVFGTKDSLSRSLESYLTEQRIIVTGENVDLQLEFLKKLAKLSQYLGSEKKAVWTEAPVPVTQHYEEFRLGVLEEARLAAKMIQGDWKDGSSPETETMQTYKCLGGSAESLLVDMEQAALMWKLRVKIDVWSQGIDESIRERNRLLLIEIYLRLPPRRVWLFVKRFRFAFFSQMKRSEMASNLCDSVGEGPEDVIAKGKSLMSISIQNILTDLASYIMKPDKLAPLMYKAVKSDVCMKEQPGINLWANTKDFDFHGFVQITAFRKLDLIEPRFIRDCGIDEVEQLARNEQLEVLRNGLHSREEFNNPLFEDGEKVELLTRKRVRSKFVEKLSGKIKMSLLGDLKDVFFGVMYPTPT